MSSTTIQVVKKQAIGAGFAFLKATRLHWGFAPLTQGQGAILTMHHVRPEEAPASASRFAPNRLLQITPEFLDAALTRIEWLGFDLVSMDEALRRVGSQRARPFVALTFDDGYIDNVTYALRILERHHAPFSLYVTTGFADRTARLWWVELEEAIRALDRVELDLGGQRLTFPTKDAEGKNTAFRTLYWMLRGGPEERLLEVIATLMDRAGLRSAALVERLCLDWQGIKDLAGHPLCTIGGHTTTHPMLAKHDEKVVRRELSEGRSEIERRIGLPVRHLSYPVGDPTSVGAREFAIAADLGFSSAVTTRPGMLFPAHRDHVHALPRVSLNGDWQSLDNLDILLSGVPFALWNRGRRVVA
jgi:peptidoglycan/xylan/chitin deacetylase (PgdA/CDA1 family)